MEKIVENWETISAFGLFFLSEVIGLSKLKSSSVLELALSVLKVFKKT